jgi:DNA polymerase (family X)
VENGAIADRLDAFAGLLELAGANPHSARAYRRAAELIRTTPAPVEELVRAGRARELRGVGASIEARLRELIETGEIAELAELEREVSPELVALARYLGVSARRMVDIGRTLGVRDLGELREAASEGRLAAVPGIGPQTEAQLRAVLAGNVETRPQPRITLGRARALVARVAEALGGLPAGDPRRFVDEPQRLTVVCATAPGLVQRFAELPQIVTIIDRQDTRAIGVTVEGVPVELVLAAPDELGTALVEATGSPAYVAGLGPLPAAADEDSVYRALGIPWCPPELREQPFRGEPPALLEFADLRGDLHCHTTWSDGRSSVEEMGRAAIELGYDYLAICDHTTAVSVVPGLDADAVLRQAEEIRAANEALAPFRLLAGIECDIHDDGALDLPDRVLAELDWVTASVHAGQRQPREQITMRVVEAMRHPAVRSISHPTGRLIGRRPPNALDLDRAMEVALETGTALEVNALPDRLDLKGEHVRLCLEAGVPIVVATDAHSAPGLANIELAIGTARRGGATAADVVNTRSLDELLAPKRPWAGRH